MRPAQGDLGSQLDLLVEAGYLQERDIKSFDNILGSFMPHRVHWDSLMGYNTLEFIADSTVNFPMQGKKIKKYPWQAIIEASSRTAK